MKQGVSVDKKTSSESTQVHLQSPSYDVRYSFITKDEFTSQYLSEENLSYCVAEPDEDEEDDYLLNHALQEDKKLCVTFWTKNYGRICHAFSSERYSVTVSDTWSEEYKTVYVARKGVLSDFYDLEQIDEFKYFRFIIGKNYCQNSIFRILKVATFHINITKYFSIF